MNQKKLQQVLVQALVDAHKVTALRESRDILEIRSRAHSAARRALQADKDMLIEDLVEWRKKNQTLTKALQEAKEKGQEQDIDYSTRMVYDAAGFRGCTFQRL